MSCYTSCSAPSQCGANSICSAGTCQKCGSGQTVCSNGCYTTSTDAGHCGSSCQVCSGSTPSCVSGACTCRQKDGANILTNPGFDGSLTGWVFTGVSYSANDAEGCSKSGSAAILSLGPNFSQCVTSGFNTNFPYTFGFLYKSVPGGGLGTCDTSFYANTRCDNTDYLDGGTAQVNSDGTTWVAGTVTGTVPAGTLSISVHCSGPAGSGYHDQLYFSQSISSPKF